MCSIPINEIRVFEKCGLGDKSGSVYAATCSGVSVTVSGAASWSGRRGEVGPPQTLKASQRFYTAAMKTFNC